MSFMLLILKALCVRVIYPPPKCSPLQWEAQQLFKSRINAAQQRGTGGQENTLSRWKCKEKLQNLTIITRAGLGPGNSHYSILNNHNNSATWFYSSARRWHLNQRWALQGHIGTLLLVQSKSEIKDGVPSLCVVVMALAAWN